MHKSPVYTRIINLQNTDRCVTLCGTKSVWLPASSEVEVPYDVWSLADAAQRRSLPDRLSAGNDIRLIVGVRSVNGTYVETELGVEGKPAEKQEAPKEAIKAVNTAMRDRLLQNYGIKATSVEAEHSVSSADVKNSESAKLADKMGFHVEEVESPKTPKQEAAMSNKEKFNEACLWKRWSEALGFLKAEFGQGIKVGIRSIMSLKDWDAVVEKFDLKKEEE